MNLRPRFRTLRLDDSRPAVRPAPGGGAWSPADIDLVRDADDWAGLNEAEREFLLRLTALCQAGDDRAALDLLPLMMVMEDEERLEEELRLTAFLWHEARHVEVFRRFFQEVAPESAGLARYRTLGYCRIVHDELPGSLFRLRRDPSPAARVAASVTYNLIVVGVLTETGYDACRGALEHRHLLGGMRRAIAHLQDEASLHLAYSIFVLSRMVAEHGDLVRDVICERVSALRGPALGVVSEVFESSLDDRFGLDPAALAAQATQRLDRRLASISH